MLVFGVDIPLVEVIFTLSLIIFFLLAEALVLVVLMVKQSNKTKKLADLVEKLSDTILSIKRAEIEELDKLRGRKK